MEADLTNYKNLHHIPLDNDLQMTNFVDFFNKRRDTIKRKLMDLLNVKNQGTEVVETEELFEEETID